MYSRAYLGKYFTDFYFLLSFKLPELRFQDLDARIVINFELSFLPLKEVSLEIPSTDFKVEDSKTDEVLMVPLAT